MESPVSNIRQEMLHLLSVQGKALREDYRAGLGETFLAAEVSTDSLDSDRGT